MRSNLFIQRQKLKQSTVWKTFFVGLFVRQSSKKSASPHPFSVNNCMCQCDRVVLDLLTFYSFCKSFFFFWVSEFFVPHFTIYDDVFWTLLLFTSQNIVFVPYWSMSAKKKSFCQKQKADVRTVIVVAKMMSHRSASAQWPKNRKVSQKWQK